jgi:hypothetical protein
MTNREGLKLYAGHGAVAQFLAAPTSLRQVKSLTVLALDEKRAVHDLDVELFSFEPTLLNSGKL